MTTTSAVVAPSFTFITESFEGRAARSEIGERAYVVFDGERRTVDVFANVGAGMPTRVWHGIAASVRVPSDADLGAVRDVLEGKGDLIEALFNLFVEVEWDGQNHVGKWADEERRAEILEALHDALHDEGALPTYWDASEWLSPAEGDVRENLLHALVEADGDLDAAIDGLADSEVENARREDALVEHADVAAVLRDYAKDDEDIKVWREVRRIEALPLTWTVMPADRALAAEVAYAFDNGCGRAYKRVTHRTMSSDSPRRVVVEFSDDVVEFDPNNGVILDGEGGIILWSSLSEAL